MLTNIAASIHKPPEIISIPDDLQYTEGEAGNNLVWQFEADESGDDPSNYTVTKVNVPVVGHTLTSWSDNVDIVVNVDGLLFGMNEYTIIVNDTGTDFGQADATVDTAIVTVLLSGGETPIPTPTPTPTPPSGTSTDTTSSTLLTPTQSDSTLTTASPISLIYLFAIVILPLIKRKLN